MKKTILAILLCGVMLLDITGCNDKKHNKEALLCTTENEKYVFYFDDNDNSIGIYHEDTFDFQKAFTNIEMQEFSVYGNKYLRTIIDQKLINCNDLLYSCESYYDDNKIINRIYVKDKEQAKAANLEEYYEINAIDLRTKIVTNEDAVCQEVIEDDNYKIKGNKTKIHYFNNVYNSVEEMNNEVDRPKYYRKYDLIDISGQKGTIEFKENGLCKIDLSNFDSESWNNLYCTADKNIKRLGKTHYIDGECTYKINNDYEFTVTYNGKYESYQYCEGEEEKIYKQQKNVVTTINQEIKLQFDSEYNKFEFTNGEFRRLLNTKGALQYKEYDNN